MTSRVNTRYAAGSVIDGRYEIIRHLGEGGFASVFLAKQTLIDRLVAVKILHSRGGELGVANFEERFLLEAKVAARIQHPNVVTIHDFGFAGASREPYLVMEYLPGHSLEDEINAHGALPPQRALPLFVSVLDALAEGHRQGVVHKDLKPANLHVCEPNTDRETMKILDFGVARLIEVEGSKMTSTGQMFGTPQYMAPEYIERNTVTPALDVYQLGLILVEALTGTCVVDEETAYLCCVTHCRGDLEIPQSILDSPLGPIVAHAIAKDHAQRFQDAAAFRDALATVDPATVRVDPTDKRSRKISSISGSQRSVASGAPSDTGAHGRKSTIPGHGGIGFQETIGPDIAGLSAQLRQPRMDTGGDSMELDRPPRSILPLVLIAGFLLLLVVGAIGAVVAIILSADDDKKPAEVVAVADDESDDDEDEAAPGDDGEESDEAADEAGDTDEAAPADEGDDKAGEDEEAPTDEKAPAAVAKSVEITSEPPGAVVYMGRKKLGTTPLAIDKPAGPTRLTLKKKGFADSSVEVGPDSAETLHEELRTKGKARAKAKEPPPERIMKPIEPPPAEKEKPKKGLGFDFADDKKPAKTKKKKSGGGMTFAD